MDINIREPKQQRAIDKKDKIIKCGFDLICKNGYYNTNTAMIAKEAGVSTGIIYQYFKDKHDIFISGIIKYGDDIFFPMLKVDNIKFNIKEFDNIMKKMINHYIENHKVSHIAHEEIMAMVHSDQDIRNYYYKQELQTTNKIKELLVNNNFEDNHLFEKVHVMIGMIDNLCHEIVYHKHEFMDYNEMIDIVISSIKNLFKNDLN